MDLAIHTVGQEDSLDLVCGTIFWSHVFNGVDANSKWPEVIETQGTTTSHTILKLKKLFATLGLPLQLVSDTCPQFTPSKFGGVL